MLAPYVSLLLVFVVSPEQGYSKIDCPNYIATPEKVYCLPSYKGPPAESLAQVPTEDVTPSDEDVVYEEGDIIPVEVQHYDEGVVIEDATTI